MNKSANTEATRAISREDIGAGPAVVDARIRVVVAQRRSVEVAFDYLGGRRFRGTVGGAGGSAEPWGADGELTDVKAFADGNDGLSASAVDEPLTSRSAARTRPHLVDEALARQIDHAALRLGQQPATYLTGLLGERPTQPGTAGTWNRHALAHYRHHILGRPYGQPAAPDTAPTSWQALGPPPQDPAHRALYEQLRDHQQTLELRVGSEVGCTGRGDSSGSG